VSVQAPPGVDRHAVTRAVEPPRAPGAARFVGPAALALALAAVALALVVNGTRSAWTLLAAGRGVVPEAYYPAWAFVLIFATTLGQAVGWAGGSGIGYWVLTRLGFPPGAFSWKLAMSLVYLGLGGLPLLVFHVIFGRPLLGMPRESLAARLAADYPDAHLLVITLHPLVDLAVIPLGLLFLALVWASGPERSTPARYAVALTVIATSLAVALSLAIHSTLVHLRF
jgi:hypothetical protein